MVTWYKHTPIRLYTFSNYCLPAAFSYKLSIWNWAQEKEDKIAKSQKEIHQRLFIMNRIDPRRGLHKAQAPKSYFSGPLLTGRIIISSLHINKN
jgi:hypothetical protein